MLEHEVKLKRPKPGSNLELVLNLAEQNYAPQAIAQSIHIPIYKVNKVESTLRNRQLLPKLTDEERRSRRSETGKLRRSTINFIEPYYRMRMTIMEIEEALSIDHKSIPRQKIETCILNARRKQNENFSPFSLEELQDIRIDSKKPEAERRKLVKDLINTMEFFLKNNIPLPKDRIGWKKAIEQFKKDGLILSEAERLRKEFVETGDFGVFDELDKLFEENPGSEERLRPKIVQITKSIPSKSAKDLHLPKPEPTGKWRSDPNVRYRSPVMATNDIKFKGTVFMRGS